MRALVEREYGGWLLRFFMARWAEVAYVKFGLSGLCFEVEFPSDWHEQRMGWVRIGLGLVRLGVAFPWPWVVPDDMQCSGPTFGFSFFSDVLFLCWGKNHGKRDDPSKCFAMPWQWRHREHKVLTEPETHPYAYLLRSGEVQRRNATIKVETRLWTRPWFPWRRVSKSIDVSFDAEVGEKSGSWKGGVTGCGYEMREHERPRAALLRMQDERRF
jgi:hypothetical protein